MNFLIPAVDPLPDVYEASDTQCLFYNTWADNNDSHTFYFAYRIEGRVSETAVDEALRNTLEAFPLLRTTYLDVGENALKAVVEDQPELPITHESTEADSTEWVEDEIKHVSDLQIDLRRSPIRVKCIRAKTGHAYLVISLHHITCDSTNISKIIGHLLHGIAGFTVEPKVRDYRDYVDWEKRCLESVEYEWVRDFWKQLLSDELPSSFENVSVGDDRYSVVDYEKFTVGIKSKRALEQLAFQNNVSVAKAVYILIAKTVAAFLDRSTVMMGTAFLSFPRLLNSEIEGPLFNILPLVIRDAEAPFERLLPEFSRTLSLYVSTGGIPMLALRKELSLLTNRFGDAYFSFPINVNVYDLASSEFLRSQKKPKEIGDLTFCPISCQGRKSNYCDINASYFQYETSDELQIGFNKAIVSEVQIQRVFELFDRTIGLINPREPQSVRI